MSNQIIPGVIESIQRSIRSFSRLNKVLSVFIGLFIPTIVGVYCTFYSDLVAVNPALFWLPVLLFIFIAGLFSYVTWDGPLPDEVLSTYLDANEKQQSFETLIAYFTTMEELISVWRSGSDVYSLKPLTTQAEGLEVIKFVMDSLILAREPLFNFKVREMWNFAVYIYDPVNDLLVPVWRDRNVGHPRSPTHKPHPDSG